MWMTLSTPGPIFSVDSVAVTTTLNSGWVERLATVPAIGHDASTSISAWVLVLKRIRSAAFAASSGGTSSRVSAATLRARLVIIASTSAGVSVSIALAQRGESVSSVATSAATSVIAQGRRLRLPAW